MSSFVSYIEKTCPARIADLEFSLRVPEHWIEPGLPAECPSFSDPTMVFPLMIRIAPASPIVLLVSARPAYENGTVLDWAHFLLSSQNMKPLAVGESMLGSLRSIEGSASQSSPDEGDRHVRFAFVEDGDRLLCVMLSAPETVARSLQDVWQEATRTFQLARPRGQTRHGPEPAQQTEPGPDVVEYYDAPAPPEPPEETPTTRDLPDWWYQAVELEHADMLKEAEDHIRSSVPHVYFAHAIASMYQERKYRLMAAGDIERARDAHIRSADWIRTLASMATSGGEGAALSLERDQFLARLGPEPA